MAIECIRDLLKLDQVIGQETSQALIEGEVAVPDTKADVARILDIRGDVVISSREVIQEKVMVEGVLRYDILYIPVEGGGIDNMDAEVGFTHYLDVSGAKPKMNAQIKIGIEHMDYELISNRKLSIKSVLNLYAKVSQILELEALREFQGLDDVEVLKDHIHGTSSGGTGHSQTMIREDLELSDQMPSIQKIIQKDVRVKVNEKKVTDNKVIVHGDIVLKLLYICDDETEPVHYMNQTIPYSHFVDIPGAYQGMDSSVYVAAAEVYVEAKENINSELRIVDAEVVLDVNAEVFEPQDGDVLIDAYSPSVGLTLKKRNIKIQQTVAENLGQVMIKESVSFPNGVPHAKKILYASAKPMITDEMIDQDRVVLEGVLSVQVVYQTDESDGILASFKEEIPFKQSLEIEGVSEDMECQCESVEDHTSFTLIAPDEVELKIVVTSKVAVTKNVETDVIIGVDELEEGFDKEGGIFIYFVQPSDSLWSVAKKYNTTITNILKYNDFEGEESIKSGDKLIIFKKLEAKVV